MRTTSGSCIVILAFLLSCQAMAAVPIADPGGNFTADEQALVTLDGSGSSDPDGDPLSFTPLLGGPGWIQIFGPLVDLTNADTQGPSFLSPIVFQSTLLRFQLTVSAGGEESLPVTLEVTISNSVNEAPVAVALGPGQVDEGSLVTLDGGDSYDLNQEPLNFSWTQTGGPDVSGPFSGMNPEFVAPQVTTDTLLSFELVVDDGLDPSNLATLDVTVLNSENEVPLADAGPTQTVGEQVLVTLDGSQSSDPNPADNLGYDWLQISGPQVPLNALDSANPTFDSPRVSETTVLRFRLVVSDGQDPSQPAFVDITVQDDINEPPVADAGQPQSVQEGGWQTTLDGGSSYDPNGSSITFGWTLVSGPSVSLQGADTANPSFQTPEVMTDSLLTFELTVNDGQADSLPDQVVVTVLNSVNEAPTAHAGVDQTVSENDTVALDGSASSDPNDDPLTFQWSQGGGPLVIIEEPQGAAPWFLAPRVDADATMVFELTVSDGTGFSQPDQVSITVLSTINDPPVADAGDPQTLDEGSTVILDGSRSYDIDGSPLTFQWEQIAGPMVDLTSHSTDRPSFEAPWIETEQEDLVFSLEVSDGQLESPPAQVVVTVLDTANAPAVVDCRANSLATVGVWYAFDADGIISATGSKPITWQVVTGPANFLVGVDTGAISWLPFEAGTFQIALRATNQHGSDDCQFPVEVSEAPLDPPQARLTIEPAEGMAPLTVHFDASLSSSTPPADIIGYQWDFADGSPWEFFQTGDHTYQLPGFYRLSLRVTDDRGGTDWANAEVNALDPQGHHAPRVQIIADVTEGIGDLTVNLRCACQETDNPVEAYQWNLGDGSFSDQTELAHTYTEGRFHIRLKVMDSLGLVGTDTIEIVVMRPDADQPKIPPRCKASALPSVGRVPLHVFHLATSVDPDGTVEETAWWFSDGTTGDQAIVELDYLTEGSHLAEVIVTDQDGLYCRDSVEIVATSPLGEISPRILSLPNLEVFCGEQYQYDADRKPSARGDRPLTWSLGKELGGEIVNVPDGMSINPTDGTISWTPATYQRGEHPVSLLVSNNAGSDFSDFTITVVCDDPNADAGCGCSTRSGGALPGILILLLALAGVRRSY